MEYAYISTIGQDSHRFDEGYYDPADNSLRMAGIDIPYERQFQANSDGDVVLHSVNNAISGFTGINILGGLADELCLEQGITDSRVYLAEGLKDLAAAGARIVHISLTVECLKPKLKEHIPAMKESLASLLGIDVSQVGITATTGEGLTGFGRGEGVQVITILSLEIPRK